MLAARSDDDAAGRDEGICRCSGRRCLAQGRRHAHRRPDAGGGPHLVDAGSHQELRRCTGRHITADQRRYADRSAVSLPSNPASALQAAPKQYVDSQVASALPLAGGTLTGALTLPGDPTTALQAATKRYVDSAGGAATGVINVRSAPYNAQLNGVTDDTAAFKAAYQAAAPGSAIYVPNGVTVLQTPSNWGIPADQAGEVDRRRHITAGRHAAVECNSGRRQSGQQLPAGTRRRQQRHQLRGLAERFAANRFRGFPFVLHRQSRRRANRRRGDRKHRATTRSYTAVPPIMSGAASTDWCGAARRPRAAPLPRNTSGATCRRSGRISPWIRQASRCRNPISGLPASNTATSPASHRARSPLLG